MNNTFFISKNVRVEKNTLWMLTNDTNVLCEFDLSNMKYLSSYILPINKVIQYGCYAFTKSGEVIYVLPFLNEDMFVVNVQNGNIKKVELPYRNGDRMQSGKFHIVGNVNNKLVMLGHNIKGIFVYDEKDIHVNYEYLDLIKEAGIDINQENAFFSDCYIQLQNKIYAPFYKKNFLFVLNIEDETYQILKIDDSIRLRTIDIINEKEEIFLFTTVDDERVIWSQKKGIIEKKRLNVLNLGEKLYMRSYYVNNKYYYIAALERKIFVEKDNMMIEIPFEYPIEQSFKEGECTQFEAVFKNNMLIFFQVRSDGSIFCIDTERDCIKRMDIDISIEQRNSLIKNAYQNKKIESIWNENSYMNLKNLLDIIK